MKSLPTFVLMLTLALGASGCLSSFSPLHRELDRLQALSNAWEAQSTAIDKKYRQALVSDPELAIIRGKSGIALGAGLAFDSCQANYSDNKYPTQKEKEAIYKFGYLMSVYFDERDKANAAYVNAASQTSPDLRGEGVRGLQANRRVMQRRLASVEELHKGRLTWAQFGTMCEQIRGEQ